MTNDTAHRVLVLSGTQSLREAAQTGTQLLSALADLPDKGDLLLDCAEVAQADLSLVQIIIAAQRSGAARGIRVTLAAAPAGALQRALERGGFCPLPNPADPASWGNPGARP